MLKAAIANYLGIMIIINMIMLHKTVNTDKKKKKKSRDEFHHHINNNNDDDDDDN